MPHAASEAAWASAISTIERTDRGSAYGAPRLASSNTISAAASSSTAPAPARNPSRRNEPAFTCSATAPSVSSGASPGPIRRSAGRLRRSERFFAHSGSPPGHRTAPRPRRRRPPPRVQRERPRAAEQKEHRAGEHGGRGDVRVERQADVDDAGGDAAPQPPAFRSCHSARGAVFGDPRPTPARDDPATLAAPRLTRAASDLIMPGALLQAALASRTPLAVQ